MRIPTSIRDAFDQAFHGFGEEPLRLLRLAAGLLLLLGTVVALILGLSGAEPRALEMVATFWALYGFIAALVSGVMEPAIEGLFRVLTNVGLRRGGGGFSAIETLVARGELAAAAEAYRQRAQEPTDRVAATVRRAALLGGPLDQPETALVELENLRAGDLSARDDLQVGLALVSLYEGKLADPGRAMSELRRLIDLHPENRSVRRLRHALADLKADRFPGGAP